MMARLYKYLASAKCHPARNKADLLKARVKFSFRAYAIYERHQISETQSSRRISLSENSLHINIVGRIHSLHEYQETGLLTCEDYLAFQNLWFDPQHHHWVSLPWLSEAWLFSPQTCFCLVSSYFLPTSELYYWIGNAYFRTLAILSDELVSVVSCGRCNARIGKPFYSQPDTENFKGRAVNKSSDTVP